MAHEAFSPPQSRGVYSGGRWEELRMIKYLNASAVASSPDDQRLAVGQWHVMLLLDILPRDGPHCLRCRRRRPLCARSRHRQHIHRLRVRRHRSGLRRRYCRRLLRAKPRSFPRVGRQLLTKHGPAPAGEGALPTSTPTPPPRCISASAVNKSAVCCATTSGLRPSATRRIFVFMLGNTFAWADDGAIGRHDEFDSSLISELDHWPPAETLEWKWKGLSALCTKLKAIRWSRTI